MKYLSYKHSVYALAIVALALAFLLGARSAAAADITVVAESDPLFSVGDLVPGASVEKTLTVTNGTTDAQDVAVAAANETDGGLASGLLLRISSGATTYYTDSFADFFAQTNVALGQLDPGDSRSYTVALDMPANLPNSYQGTSLAFDLTIGFDGTDTVVTVPGSGGGGGGGGGTATRTDRFGIGGGNANTSATDDGPTPRVLGDQVSVIPVGAPNTGTGATAPSSTALWLLLGLLLLPILVAKARRTL